MPIAAKSDAAKRFERQRQEALAALASRRPEPQPAPLPFEIRAPKPVHRPSHRPGLWPMRDLGPAQCRFACTPHTARPEEHLFCGQPVTWLRGKPTSWCAEHLAKVVGAPGRAAGGASAADLAAGHAEPDEPPARTGWGAMGGQR